MNTQTSNATSTKPKSKSSVWAKAGIQKVKRARADALLGAHPDFSDSTLARLAGVSHTFIAMRRKVCETFLICIRVIFAAKLFLLPQFVPQKHQKGNKVKPLTVTMQLKNCHRLGSDC
jgi:hypothetical protein